MKKAILSLFLFILFFAAKAQDSFDPDQLLLEARELIFDGKYQEGRKVAFRALERYPTYADILILVGRSYAWEGKNDSASIYLERAIIASPKYEDAYSAYLDNLTWADEYEKAHEIVQRAKQNWDDKLPQSLQYKESRLFYFEENYDEAYGIVEELFDQGYRTEGILSYIQNLQRLRRNSAIGATFDYDSFRDEISPWNTWSVYGRTRTKLTGALIARVTQSQRFDSFGTQYELDAYPSLGENSYAYLNVGGSNAGFFPKLRMGASIYFNLPKAWEIDGGYRYLGFTEITHIATASLGKYTGNWWLNFRFNVIPGSNGSGVSTSGNFQARYYFKTAEDFFSLQLSTGVSPDEENRDQSQLLNSYRFRLGYQQLVSPRFMLFGFTGYSWDELSPERVRNNFNISIGTEYRF
ncbi:YaiO family outer membrane beta-barrel protein [Algoriphagus kandeliae]|uniref:YaiO family outer membrane beta-barrel protein n=1 Tax=Algoriphagus kandeliae TaxID=2562278 RepID=A0A4Y9R1C8_9BACT|nr:YaiO family outer membrane beta-barrel protein [Algoriphagus kandeliae]TFV97762.1 YaiO family outer membrane beta-barrel protein [Algoriphagus kandeliae]